MRRARATTDAARGGSSPRLLEAHERGHLEAAAVHAERLYPGPVGELIARELRAHAEFGYRFGGSGLATRVARALLAVPVGPAQPQDHETAPPE